MNPKLAQIVQEGREPSSEEFMGNTKGQLIGVMTLVWLVIMLATLPTLHWMGLVVSAVAAALLWWATRGILAKILAKKRRSFRAIGHLASGTVENLRAYNSKRSQTLSSLDNGAAQFDLLYGSSRVAVWSDGYYLSRIQEGSTLAFFQDTSGQPKLAVDIVATTANTFTPQSSLAQEPTLNATACRGLSLRIGLPILAIVLALLCLTFYWDAQAYNTVRNGLHETGTVTGCYRAGRSDTCYVTYYLTGKIKSAELHSTGLYFSNNPASGSAVAGYVDPAHPGTFVQNRGLQTPIMPIFFGIVALFLIRALWSSYRLRHSGPSSSVPT